MATGSRTKSKDDGPKYVKDYVTENPIAKAQSFSERAADPDVTNESRYAVEGNELDGYAGVSEEYMTYVGESDADSPAGFDPDAQDNPTDREDSGEADDDKSGSDDGPKLPL